jgi:FAD/FMN-containing dehydrogenase
MAREALLAALRRTMPGAVDERGGNAALLPRSESELARAMQLARELGARLAPPGAEAGTGAPIAIDLQRMSAVLGFDDASRIVHVQAGCALAAVERELEPRRLTLALREAPEAIDVGTWLALGAPGAPAAADDVVSHLFAGLSVVWPDGSIAHVRPAPRRAVGPDLAGALIGARGRLGVITAVHLTARARIVTATHTYEMPSEDAARHTLAWIRGRGVRPHASLVEGTLLHLELSAEGPLAGAWRAAVLRTVDERGGVPVSAPVAAPVRTWQPRPPAAIVDQLSRALDPRGVLSPSGGPS